jgi:hypothetical protein
MVVTCAFYGFVNRTTKVTLQVDREALEVGRSLTFEGNEYVILSVFEAAGEFRANVGPEQLQRPRAAVRLRAPALSTPMAVPRDATPGREYEQETVLQARLKAAEARLEDVLRERDEALKLLDHAIHQLNCLQQMAEP